MPTQSQNNIAIVYSQVPHKKINGTLFYCFEYFAFLSKYVEVTYYIKDASDKDIEYIKDIFRDKYSFNHDILDNIKSIKSIRDIHNIGNIFSKILFLDIRTANSLSPLIRGDKLVYSNKFEDVHLEDVTYFGFYDYQHKDIKEKLKINFDIFKSIKKIKTNTAFVTNIKNIDNVRKYIDIKEDNIITKLQNKGYDNLYERFDTLYYYHNTPDANNRMIVESAFYCKDISVTFSDLPKDSVYYRYHDILENGIDSYRLCIKDRLIRSLLGEDIKS